MTAEYQQRVEEVLGSLGSDAQRGHGVHPGVASRIGRCRLGQMSAATARVIRDQARQTVPAADLVPGDIILVEEGDTIPADARVIQSTALQTAEAALTGESNGCRELGTVVA